MNKNKHNSDDQSELTVDTRTGNKIQRCLRVCVATYLAVCQRRASHRRAILAERNKSVSDMTTPYDYMTII